MLLGLSTVGLTVAGELMHAEVEHSKGHYHIHIDMRLQADAQQVYALLTDFNHLTRLNNSIYRSRLLRSRGKQHRVQLDSEGCVLFYCQQITQTQDVTEMDNGYIVSRTDPLFSNLKSGNAIWYVRPDPIGTRITYCANFVPAFWVPPLLGPWLLQDRLLSEGKKTLAGLEQLTQARP